MEFNQEHNLVIRSYLNFQLSLALDSASFLESDFFKNNIKLTDIQKDLLFKVKIGNQARLLSTLYELLIVPKETLKELTENNAFDELEKIIASIASRKESTYKSDKYGIEFIRHLRNAVAHANVKFTENNCVEFYDQNPRNEKEKCVFEIPLSNMMKVIDGLIEVLNKYYYPEKNN